MTEKTTTQTTPPELTSLTIPARIDVTSGPAAFEISASATDDLAGIGEMVIWLDDEIAYSFSPSSTTYSAYPLLGFYDSKDWADGRVTEDWSLAPANASGVVNVTRVTIKDTQGNSRDYQAEELASMGVNTQIEIVGATPETTPPKLTSLTIPSRIDVTSGPAAFEILASATDDLAGVGEMWIRLDDEIAYSFSPSSNSYTAYSLLGLFDTDDWGDGSVTEDWSLAPANASGVVNVTRVTIEDMQGNSRDYQAEELASMGVNTQIEIVGAEGPAPRAALVANQDHRGFELALVTDAPLDTPTLDIDVTFSTSGGSFNDVFLYGSGALSQSSSSVNGTSSVSLSASLPGSFTAGDRLVGFDFDVETAGSVSVVSSNVRIDGQSYILEPAVFNLAEPANIPPSASGIDAGSVAENGGMVTIDLLGDAAASDSDGGTLGVANVSVTDQTGAAVVFGLTAAALTIDPTQFAAALDAGESTVLTVAYEVTDGQGGVTPNTGRLVVDGLDGPFTWYLDGDGDGFGVDDPVTNQSAYAAPAGTSDVAGDADDADATVFPGASEINDGKDNDQDGDVDEENVAPNGVNDGYSVGAGEVLTVTAALGLLGNDSDPDGDALSVQAVTAQANGTLNVAPDGSFTYAPHAGFAGQEAMTYTVSDGIDMVTAEVMIDVTNRAPQAGDDSATTPRDTAVVFTAAELTGNDSDADGDALTIASVYNAGNGSAVLNPDGTVTFTPAVGFAGAAGFDYTVADGNGGSATASVAVTVEATNRAPQALADSYATGQGQTMNVNPARGVLSNDSDPDGDDLSILNVEPTALGTLEMQADGAFTFTPNPNASGRETLTYTVSDGTDTTQGSLELIVTDGTEHEVAGLIQTRNGDGLAGTKVSFRADDGSFQEIESTAGSDGRFTLLLDGGMSGHLDAVRDHDPVDDPAIGVSDALNVLRIAVGLDPSWGSADTFDFVSADVDQSGSVSVFDALEVLRYAVGLETDNAPKWVFIDDDADLSHINSGNVAYDNGIDLAAINADMQPLMTGVLLGNMEDYA